MLKRDHELCHQCTEENCPCDPVWDCSLCPHRNDDHTPASISCRRCREIAAHFRKEEAAQTEVEN